jgi:hypothetical protein
MTVTGSTWIVDGSWRVSRLQVHTTPQRRRRPVTPFDQILSCSMCHGRGHDKKKSGGLRDSMAEAEDCIYECKVVMYEDMMQWRRSRRAFAHC